MPPVIKFKSANDIHKPWNIIYAAVKDEKFGHVQIGTLNDAILFLYFASPTQLKPNVETLRKRFKEATFVEDPNKMQALADNIFLTKDSEQEFEVYLDGTEFQKNVWQALLKIPMGEIFTYSDVAEAIGQPKAVRAVANAIGANEISFLIPCHRVISKNGNRLKYRWGAECKKQLLDYEAEGRL